RRLCMSSNGPAIGFTCVGRTRRVRFRHVARPAQAVDAPRAGRPVQTRTEMSDSRAPLVLNVNDDEPRRYVIGRFLRDAGFSVEDAADGARALALVSLSKPDVVLLDVKLPDLSGFEV